MLYDIVANSWNTLESSLSGNAITINTNSEPILSGKYKIASIMSPHQDADALAGRMIPPKTKNKRTKNSVLLFFKSERKKLTICTGVNSVIIAQME